MPRVLAVREQCAVSFFKCPVYLTLGWELAIRKLAL